MDNAQLTVAVRLLLAVIAGSIIGLERTYHGRPAGFRTHTLVCTASSLLMLLVLEQWQHMPAVATETIRLDPTRMAQGIMTGIGFLGAGVIMKEQFTIRGLTTAASIWATAAIGIVIGMGMYFAAALAALLTLGTLGVFRWIESNITMSHYGRLMMRCGHEQRLSEQSVFDLLASHDFQGGNLSYHVENERQTIQYRLSIHTLDTRNFARLSDTLCQMKGVKEFSIIRSAS